MFRILANHIALARAEAGGNWAENDQVRDEIAQAFAALLAKELPQFYSVTIETVGQHGEIRGVSGYASKEIAEKEIPGIAEILRARREARSTNTQSEDSK